MARKSSLGPFPKTQRWSEIVGDVDTADRVLRAVRSRLSQLIDDSQVLLATTFFASLPIVTRSADPVQAGENLFGLRLHRTLRESLAELIPHDSASRRAAIATFDRFTQTPRFCQLSVAADHWSVWRDLDGSAFCELARLFFACLVEEHLAYYIRCQRIQLSPEVVRQHAWELSRITQSFSARWFNKCAVNQVPGPGNIRWYLGHCLGKLDMELERELSTHVEPLPNPFRRRRVDPPSLGLGL